MEAGFDFVAIKLLLDASCALIEILAVILAPPIGEITLSVKLRTGVVKAVGDFVADCGAHAAIIDCVIRFGIEKGRLQNPCRKHNFVHQGVVIRVYGGRRHSPFVAVHRLANFVQIAGMFKTDGAAYVREVSGSFDGKCGIITPLVRISNLDLERLQFLQSCFFGFRAHPGERGNVAFQSADQVRDHFLSVSLGFRRKILFNVNLSERFANTPVNALYAAFPSRLNLLRTSHLRPIKVEILLHEGDGKLIRTGVNHVPAQV